MSDSFVPRREFLRRSATSLGAIGVAGTLPPPPAPGAADPSDGDGPSPVESVGNRAPEGYNAVYDGARLNRVAFPMGGLGAGMICLEGTGALSHVSIRNQPDVFNAPCVFAAVAVKGGVARVLEGPVPGWKIFGVRDAANGTEGASYGLPRFDRASFVTKFPFGVVTLADDQIPVAVEITGWSPFVPGDADRSSLPVAGLEYRFTNPTREPVELVFSFNAKNFLPLGETDRRAVKAIRGGFVLWSASARTEEPWKEASLSATVSDAGAVVNHAWFRGGWWDPLTMAWRDVAAAVPVQRPPITEGDPSPGGTVAVPFRLAAGEARTIAVRLAWYVPATNIRRGTDPGTTPEAPVDPKAPTHRPWYAGRFQSIEDLTDYWAAQYADLKTRSERFRTAFYDSTLPPEVVEAVAANLTILKSPTVLRQTDGRLWGWEGCFDDRGCCAGSCTHVWNYAQAIPHLFPALERTLRETEFGPSQDDRGHQAFRTALPIRPQVHDFHAAADGQLGGIMKVHREWRISGDTAWLRGIWPKVKASLDYCIGIWDPESKGWVEEPHHNTYDIEFWGPDGMCTSFYLGALQAAVRMGQALGDSVTRYQDLLAKGSRRAEAELFNGEYFIQKVEWKTLKASQAGSGYGLETYSPEAKALLDKEGPKYQYGTGCLSDGVLGSWLANVSGAGQVLDQAKVASHLRSVHRYNLKRDLSSHANPQRPSYAFGTEGGLLLCTWPKGGALSLPFVYSDEVWTGIEYQVASHLILMGLVDEGLEVVRVCRDRYDGRIRNPFNEYECGHWYARAMSSYALLESLSGARYDAVDRILHLSPRIKGDYRSFLSTATGYGTVGVKGGKPFLEVASGTIEVKEIKYQPAA